MAKRKFYAGKSYMGTNYTYDSPCWKAYVFDSKKERDAWLEENEYNEQGNKVAEVIDRRTAYKIAGIDSKYKMPAYDKFANVTELTWK